LSAIDRCFESQACAATLLGFKGKRVIGRYCFGAIEHLGK
jgi:hypothetical protein